MLILPRKRFDPRIKPKPWGPASAVQSAIFHNAERAGIDPGAFKAVFPFWEQAGLVGYNYIGQNLSLDSGATWAANALSVNKKGGEIASDPNLDSYENGITIYAKIKLSATTSSSWAALFSNGHDESFYLHVRYSTTTNPAMRIWDGDTHYYAQSSVSATPGSEYDIIGSYDNEKITINVNGTINTTNHAGSIDTFTGSKYLCGKFPSFIGLIYQIIISDYLTPSQIAYLSDNPYFLLYPVTRPLIFDLAAAATAIGLNDITADTQITTAALSIIRALVASSVEASTQITTALVELAVQTIGLDDLAADTQVTTATIQAIRAILSSDVSTASEVTQVAITAARGVGITDVAAETQVVSSVLTVIRAILTGGVESSTEITNAALQAVRSLSLDPVSSASEITSVALTTAGTLNITSVSAQTQVTAIAMEIYRQLAFGDLSADSEVTEVVLQAIRTVSVSDVSSESQVTAVVLDTASTLGVEDVSALTSIADVVLTIVRHIGPVAVEVTSEVTGLTLALIRAVFVNVVEVETSVGSVSVSIAGITPPAIRIVQIAAENRTVVMPAESRVVVIPYENRTVEVT